MDQSINPTKGTLLLIASVFAAFFSFFYLLLAKIIPSIFFNSPDLFSLSQILVCIIAGITFIAMSFRIKLQPNPVNVILICLTLTALTTVLLPFTSPIFQLVLICAASVFFSIGQSFILTYFWANTSAERRGILGGIICSVFLGLSFGIYLVVSQEILPSIIISASLLPVVFSVIVTLISIRSARTMKRLGNIQRKIKVEKRSLLLFLLPWVLFCVVNSTLSKNITSQAFQFIPSDYTNVVIIQNVLSVFGALAAGLIADFIGRKPSVVISITLYGLSMALSAFVQNGFVLLFSFAMEAISWGMFFTFYLFVVWGDLANEKNCAKLFALGIGTYYFATALGALPLGLANLSPTTSALIACSIIFFSNLPVAFSPELLSSEARNKIKFKGYIKRIKKLEPR